MKLIPIVATTCSSIYLLGVRSDTTPQYPRADNAHAAVLFGRVNFNKFRIRLSESSPRYLIYRRRLAYTAELPGNLWPQPTFVCALLNYKRKLFSLVFRLRLPATPPPFFSPPSPNRVLILRSVSMDRKNDRRQWKRTEGRRETESEKASCIGQKLWRNTHTGRILEVRNGRQTAIHSVCCYLKIVCIPYEHIVLDFTYWSFAARHWHMRPRKWTTMSFSKKKKNRFVF